MKVEKNYFCKKINYNINILSFKNYDFAQNLLSVRLNFLHLLNHTWVTLFEKVIQINL